MSVEDGPASPEWEDEDDVFDFDHEDIIEEAQKTNTLLMYVQSYYHLICSNQVPSCLQDLVHISLLSFSIIR
jgi:hypothetical protein